MCLLLRPEQVSTATEDITKAGQPLAAVPSAVETGCMSSVETGQTPAAETGRMTAAETGQTFSLARTDTRLVSVHNVEIS